MFNIGEAGYGDRTKAAVRWLQREFNIPVDDAVMIGPLTWAVLMEWHPFRLADGVMGVNLQEASSVAQDMSTAYQSYRAGERALFTQDTWEGESELQLSIPDVDDTGTPPVNVSEPTGRCRGPGNWSVPWYLQWYLPAYKLCEGIDWTTPFAETNAIFGQRLMDDLQSMGMTSQIAYLNMQVAIHDGKPSRTVSEAITATVNQLITDIMIAEGLVFVAGVTAYYGQPGAWANVNERMSARAAAYQSHVGGRSGQAYVVNRVKFDSYSNGTLIEGKGFYAQFVNKQTGEFHRWWNGSRGLVDQANRQLQGANGTPIQWHFNESATLDAVKALFSREGIRGIEFILNPMK